MTNSDPSDIAQRCMLDSGFGMGLSAVGRHHTDGTVTLKVGDYTEQVNHCPKCGKPSVPIEALQELVEEMDRYRDPDVGKFAARLRGVIEQYE